MTWDELCADRSLNDLPYKIETNRHGQMVITTRKTCRRGLLMGGVVRQLERCAPKGQMGCNLALQTDDGVKVADVAWMSFSYYNRHEAEDVYDAAPEIVVEVLSESDKLPEMRKKTRLFFARGAKEFWLIAPGGRVRFFTEVDGEVAQSPLCPAFPTQLKPGRQR